MKSKYVKTSPDGAYAKGSRITIRKIILAAQPDKNNECAIKVEVMRFAATGDKSYKRINTGVRCKAINWDKKNEEVKNWDIKYSDKNVTIEKLYSKIKSHLLTLNTNAYRQSPDKELQEIDTMFSIASNENKKTLIEYIDDYIILRKSKNTPRGTLKEFTSLKNRLISFEAYSKKKIYFENINMTFSDNLYIWMSNLLVKQNDVYVHKYQDGTIEKTFTVLRTVLNHFIERKDELKIELSDKFQNKNFKKGTKSINDPHPISRPEFDILRKHKFDNASLEMTKQRFLFQCSTSMRYSDMFLLTKENIIDNCIVYYPLKTVHKTDNEVVVPLNPISEEILLSVGYNMNNLNISNQKYNASLKEMFIELNKKYNNQFDTYTTHDGRDTFITYAIESGIDIPTLLLMVGQNSYDVMKRYFKSTPQKKIDAMNKILEFK